MQRNRIGGPKAWVEPLEKARRTPDPGRIPFGYFHRCLQFVAGIRLAAARTECLRMSGGNGWTSGALLGVGVNHRTAPLELRERLAFDVARWRPFAPPVPHVLLTTCNRTEVYAWNEGRARGMTGQLSR